MVTLVAFVLLCWYAMFYVIGFFFFQAEDGIRDLVRSRGLGDVYKRQVEPCGTFATSRMRSPSSTPETCVRGAVSGFQVHLSLIHI